MRKYECMVILSPESDPTDKKKTEESVRKFMGEYAPSIASIEHLGKKTLRYQIAKHDEGVYVLVQLQSDAIKVSELARQAKLQPEIIRYLLTNEA